MKKAVIAFRVLQASGIVFLVSVLDVELRGQGLFAAAGTQKIDTCRILFV